MRAAAAVSAAQKARNLLEAKRTEEALGMAQEAVGYDPHIIAAQSALGDAMAAMNRKEEAKTAYERAILEAQKLEPAKQGEFIPDLQGKLAKQ